MSKSKFRWSRERIPSERRIDQPASPRPEPRAAEQVIADLRGFPGLVESEKPREVAEMAGYLLADAAAGGLISKAGWLALELTIRQVVQGSDFRYGWGFFVTRVFLDWLCRHQEQLPNGLASRVIEVPDNFFCIIADWPKEKRNEWWQSAVPMLSCFFDIVLSRTAGHDAGEMLSEREQDVYDVVIKSSEPLTAREIANRTGINESTITRHVIPGLKKKRGLKNMKGRGYYIPAKKTNLH
ncbi:MAG: hypothetical protein JXM70_14615 [Pirellulales bacterium]|nr:hypothetical protein [Pirellulales bacterium]